MRKKVLLIGDFGIDDSIALIYCILNPEIELVGVVASYGNTPRLFSIRNASFLLTLGRVQVPLIVGPERPLNGTQPNFALDFHGPYGLGPINPPRISYPLFPFNKIFDIIRRFPGEVHIISVSPGTALALTYTLSREQIITQVPSINIMGGAYLVPGNITPIAEFNFWSDPVAANNTMNQGGNIQNIPLNVTGKALVNQSLIQLITAKNTNPFTPIIGAILSYFLAANLKASPGIQGTPVHDLLAVLALVHPNLFTFVHRKVQVISDQGPAFGQSIADFRLGSNKTAKKRFPSIAVDINVKEFRKEFIRILTSPLRK
ncbi:nucleoside hydrolase [Marininema halotolerans]|uniref:Purine nucleosidase n=1 Tax=Marininema halotolerans TaxID=1155944 RepID=A0A1I6T115_9BACL|nr:nucleoside hydrolase [Marininema halotolerans]SFS82687.1 purine nucleosidase [Marininema halotolerans]